jgi:hypothetical protein
MSFCTQCGGQLAAASKFCGRCGHPVNVAGGLPPTTSRAVSPTPGSGGETGPQARALLGLFAIGGAASLFVGTLLPWIKADTVGGSLVSRSGLEEGQWPLLAMALIGGLAGLFFALTGAGSLSGFGRPRRRWDRGAHLLFGLLAAAELAVKYVDLHQRITAAQSLFDQSPLYAKAGLGAGFYLAGLGALLLVGAGIREFQIIRPAPKRTEPSPTPVPPTAAPPVPTGPRLPVPYNATDALYHLVQEHGWPNRRPEAAHVQAHEYAHGLGGRPGLADDHLSHHHDFSLVRR